MKFEVKEKNIYLLEEVYKLDYYNTLLDEFSFFYNNWFFSKTEDLNSPFFGLLGDTHDDEIGVNHKLLDAAVIAKFHAKKILKRNLNLIRLNTNIQFFGQESDFHEDSNLDHRVWSMIIFMADTWNVTWGGEFIVQYAPKNYFGVPFIPNHGVLFDGKMSHKGSAPNRFCKSERKTLAFLFEEV